jgi:hypothetical protein
MIIVISMPLQTHFKVTSLSSNSEEVSSAVYLQVSIISQALIFVTRSQGWSFMERPGTLLMCAFLVAQLVKFMKIGSSKIVFSIHFISNILEMSLNMSTIMLPCIKLDCEITKSNQAVFQNIC